MYIYIKQKKKKEKRNKEKRIKKEKKFCRKSPPIEPIPDKIDLVSIVENKSSERIKRAGGTDVADRMCRYEILNVHTVERYVKRRELQQQRGA